MYYDICVCFNVALSGDGSNSQGGGRVEKGTARRSTGEVNDNFDPPLSSTPRQQPNQTSTSFKAQDSRLGQTFSQNSSSNFSQNVGSMPVKCDHCGFIGHFANHLRESPPCIQAYRSRPEFNIQGGDEEFVVKVTILSNNCPSPECPGGSHRQIPTQCLAWWIEFGWKRMQWKGVNADSSSRNILHKLRNYRKHHRSRTNKSHSSRQQEENQRDSQLSDNTNSRDSERSSNQLREHGLKADCSECVKCGKYRGPLATHLFQSEACLQAMRRDYLAGRYDLTNPRKMIMDLSLLVRFCPNPECTSTTVGAGPIQHLRGECGQYIV